MPTGYTAELVDKGITFRRFVLQCARAFGACIMQRDDAIDVLPEKQKPYDYHLKAIKEAEKKLTKMKAMSLNKQLEYGKEKRSEAVASAIQSRSKQQAEDARLEAMAAKVRSWNPPTKDHQGLKDFMLEQIRISKNGDWYDKYVREAEEKTPEAYFTDALSAAVRDINYHTKEHEKEVERTNERNEWIEQLYRSLPSR